MTLIREIASDREFRRPLAMCALAVFVWVVFFAIMASLLASTSRVGSDIASGGRVLDYAMKYRALPRKGIDARNTDDPLGALSQIVDALELRDRMRQLTSNQSGVLIQLDKIFGGEMREFLASAENRGLSIRTAEIRALPSGGGRALNATFMLEPLR
ncbi:MAG: hypothetical protein LBT23_07520 [Synergistaceae bacterium]|jgi:hypothetical protein|nr:hypothetical protein [Synergistaceae bacterium]